MRKSNICLIAITLLAIAGSSLAFNIHTGPVYLYTHDTATGLCTVKDSYFRYTPAEPGTPGAELILGNLGNPDGKGTCDTLYVLSSEATQ